jgi:hypothetical protein
MSLQQIYPTYSFQYIQNKLVELSRQKLNYADLPEQVQADWTETDITSYAYIKNKPTITSSPLTTKGDLYTHNGSVDTRLPIGLDTQMLVADSSTATGLKWTAQPAATPTGYYGAWQDNNTQSAPASNVGVAMIFRTIDLANGVSVVTNGTNLTRITFANTGIYNLQFSSQFQNTSTSDEDVTIWLRLNGSDVAGSSGYISVPSKHGGVNGHTITSWNYLLSVVAGQYYELIWSTTNHTAITMEYYPAGSPPPSTASVILTVTQQSGIMAGTGITALNSLTGSAQTLVNGTTGTDFNIASSGTIHTFNLPTASATNRGALSSTDWTTFNNKQTALGYTPVPDTRTLTINGTTYDLSADRSWTISAGMTNPMTTAGDIIYGGASGTPTRLPIGTSGYILQAGASAPSWFNLFGTANTFTATQTISSSVSGGSFSALVLKNTSASTSQFVQIELQTGTGFYGGLKGFNDGNAGNTGQVLTLYSSKGLVFNTLGRSGAAVANTDPDMVWITSNSVSSMALFSNTASPYARLQLYTANAGTSYTEISFNGAGNITRIKGVTGGSANAGYGLLGHATTDIMRWDVNGVYIGGTTAPTANLHIIGSTTAKSSLRIASGTAPTAPNDGDIWYDGTNIKIRVGSTTKTFTIV